MPKTKQRGQAAGTRRDKRGFGLPLQAAAPCTAPACVLTCVQVPSSAGADATVQAQRAEPPRPSSASRRVRGHGVIFSSSTGSRDRATERLAQAGKQSHVSGEGPGSAHGDGEDAGARLPRQRRGAGWHWVRSTGGTGSPRTAPQGCPGALHGSWGSAPHVPIAAVRTRRDVGAATAVGTGSRPLVVGTTLPRASVEAARVTVPPQGQDLPLVILH